MDSRLTRWCDGFLEACWLVAILATPLFFNIHSERVFEPDKIALLRSLAVLMVAVWLVRFVDQQGWRRLDDLRFKNPDAIWHKPLVMPIVALLVVYGLSTIFSISPRISWAGSYQRLQGTYTTLSYVVIFAVMAASIRSAEQVRRVVSVAIVTSIPVALYGMVQHFGLDPLPWGGDVQTRVAGHMGNAIFVAAYLIMVIPLTLARIVDAFNNILADDKLSAADIVRASVYIFILAVQMLTLYWSGSRGPLIGLAVGLFSFMLVLLVSLRDAAADERGRSRLAEALPALLFLIPTLIALLASKAISSATGPLVAFAFFFGVVGLSVLAIFVMVALRRGWRWLWLGWILLTILMAGWLLLFNVPAERTAGLRGVPLVGGVFDVLDEWRELPVIGSYGRMLDPSNTTGREKSGRVRVLIWEGVVDLITPHEPLEFPSGQTDPFNWLRPLLGYGPESMYTAYNRFYPPELATVEARNASPDRSHNETFDALVITGLTGFLAWQALYLAVVLFAFRYLGVVRSRRDAWVLGGLWAGGAALAVALTLVLADPVYLGVAVPTGIIIGVIVYLVYYALFGRADGDAQESDDRSPFAPDRLLMNALVAAVLAHYVEIHFGIAISATRLYFFAYVALMYALGYRLRQAAVPAAEEVPAPIAPPTRAERRKRGKGAPTATEPVPQTSGWRALLAPAVLLMLMLGLLAYGFITYALPPDKVITGPGDLTGGEVFRQSLLQNARMEFVDWPFVMALFVLSWALGWLVFLSEMVKSGELRLPGTGGAGGRLQAAAGVFAALAVAGIIGRFLADAGTPTASLGGTLGAFGAMALIVVGALLVLNRPGARWMGGVTGAALVVLAFPLLIVGAALPALLMIAGGGAALWLLWDGRWRTTLLPIGGVVLASLLGGFLFTYLHAVNYRTLLFYRGGQTATGIDLRALESAQAGGFLTFFYAFLIICVILLAFALSWAGLASGRRARTAGSPALGLGVLVVALILSLVLISQTNIRPVQADMIYKRAKPFDDQATRSTQADPAARRELWDTAIAIYSTAIGRMPQEDFYYLFLGRAYLERAAITEDPDERAELLTTAERLLMQAQEINPLNTDHTANLARLNTRWYAAADDEADKVERLELAERYYQLALTLSPQNSVVRNELARLVLELRGDCDQALAIYEESAAIDPFYAATRLALADAYIICSGDRTESERDSMFRSAAAALDEGLAANPSNIRAWIQLAEIYRQLGEYEQAFEAVENARIRNESGAFPTYEIDFLAAQIAEGMGNTAEARALAELALETANQETTALIMVFLDELGGE